SHPPELDFIHLSQFASQLIGNDIQCSLRPKGWPCSPCRSPLAVLLEFLRRSFRAPCGKHVKVLLTGAVLAPGKRTITAVLGIMGLRTEHHFQTYHLVLNRAVWSPLTASRLLLRLLVAVFIPSGVVVFGLDDTIERRRGDQITAKGIYHDPVRSSHTHF